MIQKLTLKNFQSHKNSTLELCDGVNVIVGDSDAGKSAIIRALYWLAFGKPAGTSIRRHNVEHSTMVEAITADGFVQKIREEKTGYYILNGDVYKGFGTAIPQPILNFLNLGEINFMRQLDPLFLLSKSGGELAQYMNKLINLEIIDTSLTNIKQSVNASKRNVSACEENIARLQSQLTEYDDLPDMEKAVCEIEKTEIKITKVKKAQKQIFECLTVIDEATDKLGSLAWVDAAIADCNKLNRLVAEADRLTSTVKRTETALERLKAAKRYVSSCQYLKGLERAVLSVSEAHAKIQAIIKKENLIIEAVNAVRQAVSYYENAIAGLKAVEKEYEMAKPKTCPTCGQPWR